MTLPLIDRELRVACRRRSTLWIRLAGAAAAILAASGVLMLTHVKTPMAAFGVSATGSFLFGFVIWISFAVAGLSGLFLTSDCLSEEKREGTLGFLFLTDLTSFDVVSCKLFATSLRGLYSFLAMFPVLALSLTLGGTSGMVFLQCCLALLGTLLLSLNAGLLVSAISRESQRTLMGTLGLLLLLAGGGPAVDVLISQTRGSFTPVASYSSPAFMLLSAQGDRRADFAIAGTFNLLASGLLFALACGILPRTWQEKPRTVAGPGPVPVSLWSRLTKKNAPRNLLENNPVVWLLCRERSQALLVGSLCLLFTVFLLLGRAFSPIHVFSSILGFAAWIGPWVIALGITIHATRFLVDSRRSGVLELLLVTPVTPSTVISAHWRSLVRMYGLPILVFLGVSTVLGHLQQRELYQNLSDAMAMATAGATNGAPGGLIIATNTPMAPGVRISGPVNSLVMNRLTWEVVALVSSLGGLSISITVLAALNAFGMWAGMTSKSTHIAGLKTLAIVKVIPFLVIGFVGILFLSTISGILASRGKSFATVITFFPVSLSVFMVVLSLIKDLILVRWSTHRIARDFRELATRPFDSASASHGAVVPPLPPVLPPAGADSAANL